MPSPASHAFSGILTPNKILSALVLFLAGAAGVLAVRYLDGYIPKMIESEVTKQLQSQVKIQIGDEIKNTFAVQFQSSKEELGKKIDENNKYFSDKIIGIYEIVGKTQTLGPSLKRGTKKNHATLLRTLPVSRELLEHARTKALSEPEKAPKLTQADFNEITNNLFTSYRNPVLIGELWSTLLELASYKTVSNGIQFGSHELSNDYDAIVSLNDRELENEIIVNKIVSLGNCGVTLRNVQFMNCKFEVDRGLNGETLLRVLLKSEKPALNLRLPAPPGYVKGACEK